VLKTWVLGAWVFGTGVEVLWKIRSIGPVRGSVESMRILLLVDPGGRPRLGPRLCVDSVRSERERAAFIEVS
jgi:hypothetical protein